EKSCSARSLKKAGLGKDISFLSVMNKYRVCPELKPAMIINDLNGLKFRFVKRPLNPDKELLYIVTA
ncbi:MAG: hypothetical protein JW997_02115, partial [Actinobacteria bacterium]|nr:hypothetical protein [Actinomycetota bacterium]